MEGTGSETDSTRFKIIDSHQMPCNSVTMHMVAIATVTTYRLLLQKLFIETKERSTSYGKSAPVIKISAPEASGIAHVSLQATRSLP